MSETVLARIATLREKTTPELREAWRELFGGEPPPFNRRYLEDRIVYQLQVLTHGGLSPAARAKLDRLVDELEPKTSRRRTQGRPIAGTQLRREWQGVEHVVTVLHDGGFDWRGRRYASLSAVARAITGTRWNGPLFFGLRGGGKT